MLRTRRALKAVTWPNFCSALSTWRDSVTFLGGGERRRVTASVESWVIVRDIGGKLLKRNTRYRPRLSTCTTFACRRTPNPSVTPSHCCHRLFCTQRLTPNA